MNQGRIVPLVGPLLVLYLTLEALGSSPRFDPVAAVVCACAVAASAVPLWVLRKRGERVGARRVALLGVLCGMALVRLAVPRLPSFYLDLAAAIAVPAIGGLTAHLAMDAPDKPAALARRRAWFYAFAALGLASTVISVVAALPLEWVGGVVIPSRWRLAGGAYLLLGGLVAVTLRLLRRRMGSTPEALASGGSAHLGTWAALGAAGAGVALTWTDTLEPLSIGVRGLGVAAALALRAGHSAMLGVRRQVHAGRNTRAVVASTVTVAIAGTGAALLVDQIPHEPIAFGVAVAFALVAGAFVHLALRGAVDVLLAPYGGRLVRGAREALASTVGATTFEQLGATVLPPLRRAADSLEAEPLLFAIDPPRAVRVDAASIPHVEDRPLPEGLRERLEAAPGEVVVSAPLVEQVVRRPELRALVSGLEALDALCVVPLSVERELEGALVVPRGRRRGALTLEEIDALERLGAHLGAQIAMLSAQERARRRTRDAVLERERFADELEALEEERSRLRADAKTLKAGAASERYTEPVIAYSPAMRALMRKVDAIAPVDAPALIVGEEGTPLDRVAHRIHAASGRRGGAFVVAECVAVRPERGDAALFGESEEDSPGWLRLAEGGTLLLLDVPALSLDAQAKLAETLATRRAVQADGAGGYATDARVIATSRVPLGPLVAAGAFDAELLRRLEPLGIDVPPLRDRAEDLQSLVLVALDRACRVAGRPVMGIDAEALEALAAHDWPGNLRELSSVIDRAITDARGKNVKAEDLPPLAPAQSPADPFEGTYAEIEGEILRRALERAGGNKSEAARLLDLKRTTFIDKLKRHGLHATKKKKRGSEASPPAA